MPKSTHSRKGVNRKRWTCPYHPKEGVARTVAGKPCPTCGLKSDQKTS